MRYLIIILSLLTIKATAQDLNETIDYINDILKVNHDWLGSTTGLGPPEKLIQNPTYEFDKISIDSHGKIDFRVYNVDLITEKILNTGPVCYGYLKNLNVVKGRDYISNDVGKSLYRVILYSPTSSGGSLICPDGILDRKEFLINNSDARDRLLNAFSHLFELAKNSKDFYFKDPFSK